MARLRAAGGARSAVERVRGARQGSLREHNVSLVLEEILGSPTPISRAEVAARLGLARPTVSDLVDRLLSAGMLAELPPAPTRGAGRPAVPLVGSSAGFVAYGLEINVNHLGVCAMTLAGEVLAERTVSLGLRGAGLGEVLQALVELAEPVVTATRPGRTVVGAGVSVPGLIRQGTGTVQLAPNLGWHGADVTAALGAHPTFDDWVIMIANDADLGARAELAVSGLSADTASAGSFVFLSGEVGLGGAVIIDGVPLAGQHGWAGELGHLCVDPNGPECACGANGCLEQYVGTEALLRTAGIADRRSVDGDQVQQLLDALADEDQQAAGAVAEAGRMLGVALAGVINLIDVDAIVLGGPLGLLHPYLVEPLRRELDRRVITAPWRELVVRPSVSGPLGAARGGALVMLDGLVADPSAWFAVPSQGAAIDRAGTKPTERITAVP